MPKQTLIDQNDDGWQAYNRCMTVIETAHSEIATNQAQYRWQIYVIYRDKLYLNGGFDSFDAWTRDFGVEPFGESRSQVYNIIGAIEMWKRQKFREPEIMRLLGKWSTAIALDAQQMFDKQGELRPEVAAKLEAKGETPKDVIRRAADLSKSEARKEVGNYLTSDQVFILPGEVFYDEQTGVLTASIRWDNDNDGLMWMGTVTITGMQTAPVKARKTFLPTKIAEFLLKKLG